MVVIKHAAFAQLTSSQYQRLYVQSHLANLAEFRAPSRRSWAPSQTSLEFLKLHSNPPNFIRILQTSFESLKLHYNLSNFIRIFQTLLEFCQTFFVFMFVYVLYLLFFQTFLDSPLC